MKTGLIASLALHTAIVSWGLLAIPQLRRLEAPEVDALPVELVPFEEFSQKRAGNLEEELQSETPAEQRPNPSQEARPTESLPAEPAPQPAPAPPQPKLQAEAVSKPQAESPQPVKFASAPGPRARPKPQASQARANAQDQDFNQNEIAALLNRQQASPLSPQPDEPQALGVQGGDHSKQLSQNEIDYLKGQLEKCWSIQAGMDSAESLAVRVQMDLNPDGALASAPRILNQSDSLKFQIAAERALRAVQMCAPYSYLPAEKYESWQSFEFNFDPSRMFGR